MTGIITEIHRAALDDGPGVRTVVFFKGCLMRCLWCHNPETQNFMPEEIIRNGKREIIGHETTVDEIMRVVALDAGHYRATGGGLTLSGGEPLAQEKFAQTILHRAKSAGYHTCIETGGYGDVVPLISVTDLWLFDIKGFPMEYERLTGYGFAVVEESLRTLLRHNANVILRCPVVPGEHDSAAYDAYIDELKTLYPGVIEVQRLPFHRLGMDKYEALGRVAPY